MRWLRTAAAVPIVVSLCVCSAWSQSSSAGPEDAARLVERLSNEPGNVEALIDALQPYSMRQPEKVPASIRRACSVVLLKKGAMDIPDPRLKRRVYGKKTTLEDQLLGMALSIADNASSETQAGAVLVAKNSSVDESVRDYAMISLRLAMRYDLISDIAEDLRQRSQKGIRQAATAEQGVPEIVQKGILSASVYETMCKQIERERASSDNATLMRALARAGTLTTAGADMLFTGITSGTRSGNEVLAAQAMSGKMGPDRVALVMRLVRYDRSRAESALEAVSGASPEYIRPYQGEILKVFRDPSASEKTRTWALVGLTKLGAEIPKEELLRFLEQCKSGEAASRVMFYLSALKVKLTPEERMKFKSLVQNEEHKRWFDEARRK